MIYRYYPTASCRMGALWALSAIEDACIIEFGPAGTTHFSLEGISNLNGTAKAHAATTHISERDLTFGNTTRLENAILELDQLKHPKFIFVMSSTLASVIGIDIQSTLELIKDRVSATLIPIKSDGFQGDYTYGVKEVLDLIADYIVQPSPHKRPLTYNLIGSTMDSLSARSDINALQRLLFELFGATCHTVFTSNTTIAQLECASEAVVNIPLRQEALIACETLNNRFNQPFIDCFAYGVSGTSDFLSQLEHLTGWQRNSKRFTQMDRESKATAKRVREAFYDCTTKIALSGDFNVVEGVGKLMTDFGFTQIEGLVHHKLSPTLEKLAIYTKYSNANEKDKITFLEHFQPHIILGDGVLIQLAHEYLHPHSYSAHQISNPNLDLVRLHHEMPHMGYDGINYLAQTLLNSQAKA